MLQQMDYILQNKWKIGRNFQRYYLRLIVKLMYAKKATAERGVWNIISFSFCF